MLVFKLWIRLIKSYPLVTHWLPTELPTSVQKSAAQAFLGKPLSTPSILKVVTNCAALAALVYNFNGKFLRKGEKGRERIGGETYRVRGERGAGARFQETTAC
jgi:hypothetical protein